MSMSSLRLLQLCSANLPTGAYAFSQGLETATEEGWVSNFDQAYEWLDVQLMHSLAVTELPLLLRVMAALNSTDHQTQQHWNDMALALREAARIASPPGPVSSSARKGSR